ncbi:MAG: sulfotransferase domain-containing protein, partial [Actinomycetota bacterium]|nr:sulfotransferase domain-containing protein [Actinomycetota bacterium]
AEPQRLAGEVDRILADERYYSYAHENFSYMTQGHYREPLQEWLEHYPRERVHVELSERFAADPQGGYDRVLEFLGLPPRTLRDASPRNTIEADPLDPAVHRELSARMAEENDRLEEFLGVDLGWDRGEDGR